MGKTEIYQRLVGQLLDGRYQIEKLVGVGGMAVVYKSTDTKTGKTVAVKKLKDDIAAESDAQDRFLNEAKAVSLLSHPNIVGIYESCLDRPERYLVMEYVEGISLRTYMDRRGKLSLEETVSFSEQILAALEHAHNAGVVHRDIKPQNILLLKSGIVKVTDFGIAKIPDSETALKDENAIGTVYYISPEQAEGGECDNRSDLYSLGVMMYEMATGQLPFRNDNAAEVLMMQMQQKPERPRSIRKDIPRGLEEIILSAMEKHPEKRYQSALDMFRELRKLKNSRKASVRTPSQVKSEKRSEENRKKNPPSRSFTPVVLGIAAALLLVAIVAGFTALDRLKIGDIASVSITVPDTVGKMYLSEVAAGEEAYNELLNSLGLASGYEVSVEYVYSAVVPEGQILRQNPSAGSSRKTPCSIKLTVSLGTENTVIPAYAGNDWRVAMTELRAAGFMVSERYENNPIINGGCVIGTYPEAGTAVKKGSTVILRISSTTAEGTLELRDFTGLSEVAVKAWLDQNNLTVGQVIYTRSAQEPGRILFQSPAGGEVVFGGTAVDFVVSGGEDFGINYYPDVTGKAELEAGTMLELLGCKVDTVRVRSALPKGTVVFQSPLGGTQLTGGETVVLSVSSGEDYAMTVTMFSVVGETEDTARVLLQGGFRGQTDVEVTIEKVADTAPVGTVIAQSIGAGETVAVDNGLLEITLTVSGGPHYVPETTEAPEETGDPGEETQTPETTRVPEQTTGTPEGTAQPQEETTGVPAETTGLPEESVQPPVTEVPPETAAPEPQLAP